MLSKKTLGLDAWFVDLEVTDFLRAVRYTKLELFDLTLKNHEIHFYAHVWQRRLISFTLPNAKRRKTSGALGYVFSSLVKPYRMIAVIISLLLWYACSHTIFEITIRGESAKHEVLIRSTLTQLGYFPPFLHDDMYEMKAILKKKLANDIAWLEIYQEGSRYVITYTPKEFASIHDLKRDALVAQEDGVIARFEVLHGLKMRRVNEFVHKGDVLVDNKMFDSNQKEEKLFVEGKVYAYVWKDVRVSMPQNKLPKSLQFFDLLLEARRIVAKDFRKGDEISKENILHFTTDMGKIEMIVHYTLYKDITTPK